MVSGFRNKLGQWIKNSKCTLTGIFCLFIQLTCCLESLGGDFKQLKSQIYIRKMKGPSTGWKSMLGGIQLEKNLSALIAHKLNMSHYCKADGKKTNEQSGCLNKNTVLREVLFHSMQNLADHNQNITPSSRQHILKRTQRIWRYLEKERFSIGIDCLRKWSTFHQMAICQQYCSGEFLH